MTNLEDVLQNKLKATNKRAIVNYKLFTADDIDIDFDQFSITNYFGGKLSFGYDENKPTAYLIKSTGVQSGEKCEEYLEGLKNLQFDSVKFNDNKNTEYDYEQLKDGTISHNGKDRVLKNKLIKRNCNLSKLVDVEITKTVI
jgi:hypothetical protein